MAKANQMRLLCCDGSIKILFFIKAKLKHNNVAIIPKHNTITTKDVTMTSETVY